jgi:hypothetical protein
MSRSYTSSPPSSSMACNGTAFYSDNKEEVIERNQYSEIQEYTEEKYRITVTKKNEKFNITTDHTVIY